MPRGRLRQRYTIQHEVLNDEGLFERYAPVQAPAVEENSQDGSAHDQAIDMDYSNKTMSEEYQLSLSRHFASSANCILLSKSQDDREFHYLTPQYNLDTCSLIPLQYGFLGLRWLKVAGGQHLVSFCINISCPNPADDGSLYEKADFASTPADVLFGEHSTLCTCARALIEAAGGEDALRVELAAAQLELEQADPCLQFSSAGHTLQLVQAGEHFRDWGIVKKNKCQTCEGQQSRCAHLQKLRGEVSSGGHPADWLSTDKFQKKLEKVLPFCAIAEHFNWPGPFSFNIHA
jgi:hypothetical protein